VYSVVIADDEQIVLDVLERYFSTVKKDFSVTGKFLNGEEAYKFLKENPSDLVITDIRMGGMTGLELIENLKADGFSGKFIIVSAYDEFQYAQKAIKYGVEDYILKPIDFVKFGENLNNISKKIDKIKQNSDTIIPLLYSQICYGLLLDKRDISEKCEKLYNGSCAELKGILIKIHVNGINKMINHDDAVLKIITNVLNIKFKDSNMFFEGSRRKDDFYIIASEHCNADDIFSVLNETLDINTEIKIYPFKDSGELFKLTRFLKTYNEKTLLLNYLANNEKEKFVKLADIISNENNGSLPPEITEKLHLFFNDISADADDGSKRDLWYGLAEQYANNSENINNEFKKRITEYINENMEYGVRRDDAADFVNYHPVYFSRQFAKVFGMPFQEYVTSVKMEKAKEYILNDMGIERTAELVGYSNYKYFVKNFKKYVGVSPMEFYAKGSKREE